MLWASYNEGKCIGIDCDATSPGGRRRKVRIERKEGDRLKDREGRGVIYAR